MGALPAFLTPSELQQLITLVNKLILFLTSYGMVG